MARRGRVGADTNRRLVKTHSASAENEKSARPRDYVIDIAIRAPWQALH
jgi:hypothetical protein